MRALVRPLNAFEKLETEGGRPTPSPTTARRLDAHRSIVNFLTSISKDSFSNCPIARSSNNYPELCSTSSGQDSGHGGNSESHSPAFHPWPKLSQERGQGVSLARRQTTFTLSEPRSSISNGGSVESIHDQRRLLFGHCRR
jgi:hypothetical protein